MLVIILTTVALLILWAVEYVRHYQRVHAIPIRVHINGTRGKSSVTRLIAAGLRAGGLNTMAKTTGTMPRIIDEKGLEIPIERPHGTNIIEQVGIVDFISQRKPKAMVMECMAVQPEFQWICEHRMIYSTVGVITNARLDHIREMGPTIENITRSLCNTLPKKGVVFTSEKKMLPVMKKVAARKRTNLIYVDPEAVELEEMHGFDYVEHRDNVALALEVCSYLGVKREPALNGMYTCHPDAGALRILKFREGGCRTNFVNALAANDSESTLEIWKKVDLMYPKRDAVLLLLNTRTDRFDRSIQLLEMISLHMKFDYLLFTGEEVQRVYENSVRLKMPKDKLLPLGKKRPEELFRQMAKLVPDKKSVLIMAMGNAGGGGLEIANYIDKKAAEQKTEAAIKINLANKIPA